MIYWAKVIFKLCIRLIPLYIVAETMMYGGIFNDIIFEAISYFVLRKTKW